MAWTDKGIEGNARTFDRQLRYAIRMPKFINGKPSGKADGMYIRRKDHLMTDHAPNAEIFLSETAAELFIATWRETTNVKVPPDTPLYVVEVETKEVVQRQVRVVSSK